MATASTQPRGDRVVLVAFFLLAFGFSWAVWLPAAAASRGLLAWEVPSWLGVLLGSFGPTLAALPVTAVTAGRAGLRGLLGRLLIWRVGLHWYAFALVWPAVHSLAATAIQILLGAQPRTLPTRPFCNSTRSHLRRSLAAHGHSCQWSTFSKRWWAAPWARR
jgi:hypothetical protein